MSWLGYDHYRPWVNFHSEALACAGVLLLLVGRSMQRGGLLEWPLINGWIAVAALAPWLWLLFGIGVFAGDALITSMYLLMLAGSVTIGYGWASRSAGNPNGTWLTGLAAVTLAVAILSAAIGLLQWLVMSGPLGMYVVQTDPGDRAMGNLGQPNQLGTLLLAGLSALLYLFESRTVRGSSFSLAVGFLTSVLVLTQSRAAMVGVVVVAAFLLAKMPRLQQLRRRHVVIWAAGFWLATAALPTVSEALLLSESRSMASLTHTSDRLIIWKQTVAGIAAAPWFGYGWNQTPTAHAAGALAVAGTLTYGYAHNIALDLLAWNGVPLGMLWIGLIAYWLLSRLRRVRTPAAVCAMAALLPLAVHSLLEFPFAYAYFLGLGGLLIGIVEATHPSARAAHFRRRWVWAAVIPWTAIGAYVCYEYLLIEEDFRIVRFENLRIGQTPAAYQVPHIWMLSHMAEMLKASRARPEPGMSAEDIDRLRKVALRFPYGALHLRYAGALALNGDTAGAARQMRVIRGMFGDEYYAAGKYELLELRKRFRQTDPLILP